MVFFQIANPVFVVFRNFFKTANIIANLFSQCLHFFYNCFYAVVYRLAEERMTDRKLPERGYKCREAGGGKRFDHCKEMLKKCLAARWHCKY